MPKTLIDLRGLNYPYLTGVNTVTLHILYSIAQNPKLLQKLNLSTFGLSLNRLSDLRDDFPWLSEFSQKQELDTVNFTNNTWHQILNLVRFYTNLSHKSLSQSEIFYQTQPKPFAIPKSCKYITTFHDLSAVKDFNQPNFKQKLQENKYAYQKIADRADKIITCSYATAYDLVKTLKVPENKVKVIYQALPIWDKLRVQKINQLESIDEQKLIKKVQKPYFLALSAFEYRKNYHNLIVAWKLISKNEPSIYENHELIIAGSMVDRQYFKYLTDLIQKLELKNVRLLTDISNQNKQDLLQNCVCLVYTSLYEGFGFPILEAQKYGKAVLTSNVSSMPEISGKGSLLVNPLDCLQISEGLAILAKDNVFRKMLESESESNLARFSWGEYQKELESVLI